MDADRRILYEQDLTSKHRLDEFPCPTIC